MWEYIISIYALLELYSFLHFFILKRRIKGPVKIVKGAEPFYKKRGKKVALLIHGFTSSPREFRSMGNFLAKNNISVYAPLLPGHGTSPERLAIIKYVQWIEFIEEKIKMLAENHDEIFLVGNSFGGNLALISANKSKKIKGVVTLGTPIYFRNEKRNKYLIFPILKRIKIFQKKRYKSKYTEHLIKTKGSSYKSIPLRSLGQVGKIVNLSKTFIKNIKKPVLVMVTPNDPVSRKDSVNYIIDNLPTKKKRVFTVPESYHVFILDKYAHLANKEILKFIKNRN